MPRLLGVVEVAVEPDDGQILIVGGERDVVALSSASELRHEATVTLQAWDGEAPAPDGQWEEVGNARVLLSVGSVELPDLGERLTVGPAGWYAVRAHVAGRDALRRWSDQWDGSDTVPVGLERFVVQFWLTQPVPVSDVDMATVLVERPTALHLDDNGRLHCATAPALVYPDGWHLHARHGRRVPGSSIE